MGATASTLTGLAGSLNSVIGATNQIAGTFGLSTGLGSSGADKQRRKDLQSQQDLALAQLQAQQNQDMAQAQANADIERQRIAQDATIAEADRRDALKRAVARQRASFGSSGAGTSGGSSEAVLLGLFEESEEEKSQRDSIDALRFGAIDQSLADRSATNTLRRTQLQEKQNLQRALLN